MAEFEIKKYAICLSNRYGYGSYDYRTYFERFEKEATLSTEVSKGQRKDKKIVIEPAFSNITFMRRKRTGLLKTEESKIIPELFLVSGDGLCYYEYLTGIQINLVNGRPHGSIILRELSAISIQSVDATSFANELKKYSEEELKLIANEIRRLAKNAEQWAKNYDTELNKFKRECEVANAGATSTVNSKFGKF